MNSKHRTKTYEANKKYKGLKELRRLWVYPEDEAEIRKFANGLVEYRNKNKQSHKGKV